MTVVSSRLASLCICTLLFAGCATAPALPNCTVLSQEAKEFGKMLRWREADAAMQRVKPAPDGPRPAWESGLKSLEIVDYAIKELTCKPGADQAQTTITLSYLRVNSATLRTSEVPVTWQYLPSGTWQIISTWPQLP